MGSAGCGCGWGWGWRRRGENWKSVSSQSRRLSSELNHFRIKMFPGSLLTLHKNFSSSKAQKWCYFHSALAHNKSILLSWKREDEWCRQSNWWRYEDDDGDHSWVNRIIIGVAVSIYPNLEFIFYCFGDFRRHFCSRPGIVIDHSAWHYR